MDWGWSGKGEHDHSIDLRRNEVRGMFAISDYITAYLSLDSLRGHLATEDISNHLSLLKIIRPWVTFVRMDNRYR
jgi:hypothetical protein